MFYETDHICSDYKDVRSCYNIIHIGTKSSGPMGIALYAIGNYVRHRNRASGTRFYRQRGLGALKDWARALSFYTPLNGKNGFRLIGKSLG